MWFSDTGQQDEGGEGTADEVAGVGQETLLSDVQCQPVTGRPNSIRQVLWGQEREEQ